MCYIESSSQYAGALPTKRAWPVSWRCSAQVANMVFPVDDLAIDTCEMFAYRLHNLIQRPQRFTSAGSLRIRVYPGIHLSCKDRMKVQQL